MPSLFDRRFKLVGFPLLLNQYGESITYWPLSGDSRSINAIINRSPLEVYDAAGGTVVLYPMSIRVYADSTTGISPSELNTGGDEIELLERVDDTETTRKTVMVLQSQTSGVLTLALK
jgi:hypothetical protein